MINSTQTSKDVQRIWASTTKLKLRKIASQQSQAVNAIPKNDNLEITNSRKFMEENSILKVYKINLYQVQNFMFREQNEIILKSFETSFNTQNTTMKLDKAKITLLFQKEILKLPVLLYYHTVFLSGIHSPIIQLTPQLFFPLFKSTIKENLLKLKTETNYF